MTNCNPSNAYLFEEASDDQDTGTSQAVYPFLEQAQALCDTCAALETCKTLGDREPTGIWGGIPRYATSRKSGGRALPIESLVKIVSAPWFYREDCDTVLGITQRSTYERLYREGLGDVWAAVPSRTKRYCSSADIVAAIEGGVMDPAGFFNKKPDTIYSTLRRAGRTDLWKAVRNAYTNG